MDRFKEILEDAFPYTYMRRDQNCIVMQFSEFRMDIVPAFQIGGLSSTLYQIPDSVRGQWVQTDPFTFASKITRINSNMGSSFVPLIKMVKGWNRHVDWPIRSFHLECMLEQRHRNYSQGYTYDSMLVLLFEDLPGMLQYSCFDPVTGDRVDDYLDNSAAKTKR